MIAGAAIYEKVEGWLEPSWPLQVAMAAFLIGVTLYLLYKRNPVWLATWLVYMFMP